MMCLVAKLKSFINPKKECNINDMDYRFIPNPHQYMMLREKNDERYKHLNRYLFEQLQRPVNKRVYYELALHLLFECCDDVECYALLKRFRLNG